MAFSFGSGWQLPNSIFNPIPDMATLPVNLITVGIYIAETIILSALRPLPHVVVMFDICVQYAFGGALAMIFLFGLGMILLGWLVADNPTRYIGLGRTVTRASHVVLVFTVAFRELVSATPANTANK